MASTSGIDSGASSTSPELLDAAQSDRALQKRLTSALVVPATLLLCVGALLLLQINRLYAHSRWLSQSHEAIGKFYALDLAVREEESALRGYLLSPQSDFLETFARDQPRRLLERLSRDLARDEAQSARLREAAKQYEAWRAEIPDLSKPQGLRPARETERLLSRKNKMEAFRGSVRRLKFAEEARTSRRKAELDLSGLATRLALAGLLLAAAVAIVFSSRSQLRDLGRAYHEALSKEREQRAFLERENWVRRGKALVSEAIEGDFSLDELVLRMLVTLSSYVKADLSSVFVADGDCFQRRACLGLGPREREARVLRGDEGVLGLAIDAKGPLALDVPEGYFKVRAGTGEPRKGQLVVFAARAEGRPEAVIELAFLRPVTPRVLDLIERISESVGIAIRSSQYKATLRDLLEESRRKTEELKAHQRELTSANEVLRSKSQALLEAQRDLEAHQRDLTLSNARLEEQAATLRQAERALTEKARELERASHYKSEFLANMSHELRTPLNSSLILARLLADNREGNLSREQVRFAETIYAAGKDLLDLINDVLDLSKVEAGHMDMRPTEVTISRIVDPVIFMFEPVAKERGLTLHVELHPALPKTLHTDLQRVQQILRNLMSNALKFTSRGGVTLKVLPEAGRVRFDVIDTGIGIAHDKQQLIFEAFRQLDGTSDRKQGGTGLGLAISKDLARLLDAEIRVSSEPEVGSTFSLVLPTFLEAPTTSELEQEPDAFQGWQTGTVAVRRRRSVEPVADDRELIAEDRRTLLVIEDDGHFATILRDLAREHGFQCVVAHCAREGLRLASEIPPSAIVLDLSLPDHSGISVLDRLKHDADLRHVPVYVASVLEQGAEALSLGALGYLRKPATREDLEAMLERLEARLSRTSRRVLVVAQDACERAGTVELLSVPGVHVDAASSMDVARELLEAHDYDCVVSDLSFSRSGGLHVVRGDRSAFPPIVVHAERPLSEPSQRQLDAYASSMIVKNAQSKERLLHEVLLFVHQAEAALPDDRKRLLNVARDRECLFEGRNVLVVEDDVRNVFALTAVLEPRGVNVLLARNGREALALLHLRPDVDLVLMDMMMPEMDGVTATRLIRQDQRFHKLPIIAVTAQAVPEDQQRCYEAGVNDFAIKPIDVDMMLSLLRAWMPHGRGEHAVRVASA